MKAIIFLREFFRDLRAELRVKIDEVFASARAEISWRELKEIEKDGAGEKE